jgi:hypothetical protein
MEHVLPEELTGPQLLNKFPAFYGIGKFITAFTTVVLTLSKIDSVTCKILDMY